MLQCVFCSVFGKQSGSETLCPFYGLLILPCPDEFRVAAEQYIRDFPAIEFRRPRVNRCRKKPGSLTLS